MILWWFLGLILFFLIAFWPARIAASKGRSFFLWFLLSIPFWWITLFVVLAMKDDTKANAHAEV
jgi:ABC-type dipeptide/oligopeptide/nickel transport system permease component